MTNLDQQIDYWNRTGPEKPFQHPVNLERLKEHLSPGSQILDFGCGYGRVLGLLADHGYQKLVGFDPASAMVAAARARYPSIDFQELATPAELPLPAQSVDATLLFSVLTCIPTDEGQRAIFRELERVLRPGGLLYVSDLWLQTDERNRERYGRYQSKYGRYGVFCLPEGVTVRAHDPAWLAGPTSNFRTAALGTIEVVTMNRH